MKGYTLIEMLVVIVIFAVIGIISSETIILTLRSTYKADASSKVRQNVDYAVNTMERVLRGARPIPVALCDNSPHDSITFPDQLNNSVTFSCISGAPSYIASNSATLTSNQITFSACSFTCTQGIAGTPQHVTINVTADDVSGQNTPVSSTTQITLRSY